MCSTRLLLDLYFYNLQWPVRIRLLIRCYMMIVSFALIVPLIADQNLFDFSIFTVMLAPHHFALGFALTP
jgi:hypothetical protein